MKTIDPNANKSCKVATITQQTEFGSKIVFMETKCIITMGHQRQNRAQIPTTTIVKEGSASAINKCNLFPKNEQCVNIDFKHQYCGICRNKR